METENVMMSIEDMLAYLTDEVDVDKLSSWEIDFIGSVSGKTEFTEKQGAKIAELYEKYS
jgi:hypothetical protein